MLLKESTAQSSASEAPRVLSKAEAGFLEEVNERLAQLLNPTTETHVPVLLSGARDSGLAAFLERAIEKLEHVKRVTNIVVFTPNHVDGVLQAQAEAFEAMYPALKINDMQELPPSFWCSLVKAEMGKQSPKRSGRVIVVDRMEDLFAPSVDPSDRAQFLKNLIEIAQSYATAVVLVVDHAMIGRCDELHELKTSLGSRFHVRVPVIGQPVTQPTGESTDWSKYAENPAEEGPKPKPITQPVPIAAIVAEPNEESFEELTYDADPVPVPSSVADTPDQFWRQMTWVWMAGYGVALVMIAGLVILGTSIPENPKEVTAESTPVSVKPPRNLIPVSAAAADLPANNAKAYQAGQDYFFGAKILKRDPARAVDLLLPAAKGGHPQAAYLIGVSHIHGHGADVDYDSAQDWFERAIEAGGPEAFQELALMKERGLGGSPDRPAAARLYREGAEAGSRFCMEKCAALLALATGDETARKAAAEVWQQRALTTKENQLQRQVRELAPGLYE